MLLKNFPFLAFGIVFVLVVAIYSSSVSGQLTTNSTNKASTLDEALTSMGHNLTESGQNASSSEVLKKFQNVRLGLSFLYPSEWGNIVEQSGYDCREQTTCLLMLEGGNSGSPLAFALFKEPKEKCNYCNSLKDFVKQYYDAQIGEDQIFESDNQTTFGKNYSGWLMETSQVNSDGTKGRTDFTLLTTYNNTYYWLVVGHTNESQGKVLPQFKKLIESIEFSPIQIPVTKTPSFMDANETQQPTSDTPLETDAPELEILSHNSFTDSIGYLHVVGEVKNNSPSTANFVKVIGTFYDSNDQVVATDFTYTNPSDISSGGTAPFEITLLSASVPISQIDNYKLIGTSE